jgi:predicted DNA binding CopG/RHH family protein
MKKKIPTFKTDAEAERFVATSDLTQYDLSGAKPVRFEFEPKASQLNMRLPANLLDAVKRRAKQRGIPYTRFVREVLEQSLQGEGSGRAARRR